MTVEKLKEDMSLTVFCLSDPDAAVKGAYCGDLLSWVMGRAEEGNAWLTIMSNQNVAAVAVMTDLSCIILTEGVEPDPALADRCEKEGLNLLGTQLSTFDAAARLSELLNREQDHIAW